MLGKILGLGGSKRNLIPICNDMVGAMLEAQSFCHLSVPKAKRLGWCCVYCLSHQSIIRCLSCEADVYGLS